MRYEETNCDIHVSKEAILYAACNACSWVGPWRMTESQAKRDAIRHHEGREGWREGQEREV